MIDALELVQTLAKSETTLQAVDAYDEYLSSCGYDEFSYGLYRDISKFENNEDFVFLTNYRDCVTDLFVEIGLENDVSLRHCLQSTSPFWWRDPEPRGPNDLTWSDTDWKFIRSSEDVGLKNGLTLPVHVGAAGRGAFTLKRAPEEPDSDHRRFWREHGREVELSAWIFHLSVDQGPLHAKMYRLTSREIDVLSYLASGMSQQNIAAHLDKHLRTIEDVLRSVRRKLNAKTTAEAVARAVACDIVKP